MPKVIDNFRDREIAEACEELLLRGYEALTIRLIAKKLGIGLGTGHISLSHLKEFRNELCHQ